MFPKIRSQDFEEEVAPVNSSDWQKRWFARMLKAIPFVFDFESRVDLFYDLIDTE